MKPVVKQVALSDDAKGVMDLLKKAQRMPLNDLKSQASLSNKKWDKSIKELTKNRLAKVEKTDEELLVSILGE